MPVDPSISLQATVPNPTNYISGFLDLGQKKLNLDKSRQTFDADVANTQAISQQNQAAAQVATANVQPLIAQQAAVTSSAQTGAKQASYNLTKDQASAAFQQAGGLISNPAFSNADALAKKAAATQDPNDIAASQKANNDAAQAVLDAKQRAIDAGVSPLQAEVMFGKLVTQAHSAPGTIPQTLSDLVKGNTPSASQGTSASPTLSFVPTQGGTQPYNTNPLAGPIGPTGAPMVPPNTLGTDTSGNPVATNATAGTSSPLVGVPSKVAPAAPVPQMSMPPGETPQTMADLQGERTAAKGTALSAPQMHDINRNIIAEVDKGINTGTLGQLTQKLSSATGFQIGDQSSTDYNVLGKMLERSALTAAQGMGPHTNAGLEAQVRANGSTDYTPQAIRKIATLNDALTTGTSLYQSGLENAIGQSGSVFAKRQFDQQWSGAMNPTNGVNGVQALRLKNAVDNGDQKEQAAVLQEVGGRGSKGANALFAKLQSIRALSGQ